ncbi:hypothetical protein [Pedobacter frigiditerrae]|uniref:hypothetical protein n=1 Tax=Pedobacter frigiditerrae TaxID=2530452 RepID=UPI00292FF415|nr:hypothetical protein [Pedobacter frigiditerrae]
MRKGPSLKQIKRIPLLIFALIIAYFFINLLLCYRTVDKHVLINARLKYGVGKTYSKVNINGNDFVTGYDGEVRWKINNLSEALLINLCNDKAIISFYDLFFMLIINTILFFTIKKMKEDTIYSNETINGVKQMIFLLVLYPAIMTVVNLSISRWILEQITDNKLTLPIKYFSYANVLLSIFLVQLIPLFIKKGQSLQQENELTI